MLEPIQIKIDDLVLDPNNPRFIRDLRSGEPVEEGALASKEAETLTKFGVAETNDEEDVANIKNLFDSMVEIGFVAIDRVVVREIDNSTKYLVIEGNRRIATVKKILEYLKPDNDSIGAQVKKKLAANRQSFEIIPCKLLVTKDLSKEEIAHRITVILGLRHHGSLLEWEPLPRAYNIYKEYMGISPEDSLEFALDGRKIKEVSARLSISKSEVSQALKTYVVYLQLGNLYPVKGRHYSLIQAAVTNKSLASYYLNINLSTFELDDVSLERMNELCQFSTRDSMGSNKKKIIEDPKVMARFGTLIKNRENQDHLEAKRYIDNQIKRVLDDDQETGISVEDALDAVINYINRSRWVDEARKLLVERERKLDYDEYTGKGNDRLHKEGLRETLKKIQRAVVLER